MHRYRTHDCGALRASNVGAEVRLSGWVHRVRDHGGLLFIDLRDHYGLTQIVADPDSPAFATAEKLRGEWCIRVDGAVRNRPAETLNPNLPTGEIEIFAREIEVLSEAPELPLPVFGEPDYPEDTRLKYRFLDLRRESLHKNIMQRVAIVAKMRELMRIAGFNEFTTPILTASSPEGARDFLVPSRLHPGKFYALPQAPQQFKQLIMMAGFDRYFQIAPCFRDEDPRADRLPGEFYQLDVEMSFVEQEDVFSAMEPVIHRLFREFRPDMPVIELDPDSTAIKLGDGHNAEEVKRFRRIAYWEAMRKYGTDKPDLRLEMPEMEDVTGHFRGSGFGVFANQIASNPDVQVWAIRSHGGGNRAFCDRMNSWAQREGQPGLGYIIIRGGQGTGPIANRIGRDRTQALQAQLMPAEGDAIFFVCGVPSKFVAFAGAARQRIGEELDLLQKQNFAFAWIVDFPMYEWNEEAKKVDFAHNPFSMPNGGLDVLDAAKPLEILAHQYDIVCNGYEIASGAIRNHKPEIMRKAFAIAGYGDNILEAQFGGMLRALQYGAPPHGGMAAGLDRIVMLLCGEKNLREITMFPMNQRAEDLLMGAPSEVSSKQLRELHIRLMPKD